MFSFSVNFFKECYILPAAHVKVEQAHSTVQLKLIAAMEIITIWNLLWQTNADLITFP